MTPNATFLQTRNASLKVANSLYCYSSSEFKEIQNAWYAVNVGDEFVNATDDVVAKSITQSLDVNCGTVFVPEIKIQNGGTNPITSVELSYSIDGGAATNETIDINFASCEDIDHKITSLETLSKGAHILKVTASITSDGRADNNSISTVILANDSGKENEINSFENSSDVLIAYNERKASKSLWERGIPTGTLLKGSGNNVYGTNLDGNHPDITKAYLVSQCYDLTKLKDTKLKYKMGFDLEENWDIIYIEYSTDRGSKWDVLSTKADPNWYNSDRTKVSGGGNDYHNCPGAQWTGLGESANGTSTNADFHEYSYNLSAFDSNSATPASNIILRFTFHSDDATNEEGVIIDDFGIEGENILSIEENVLGEFSYYPNPTKRLLHVSLNPKDLNENIQINLFDLSGRNVYSNSHQASANFKTTIELPNLTSGMYLMDVNQGNKSQFAKIIIK